MYSLLLQAMTKVQEATVSFWLNGVILLKFPKSKDVAFYRWKALTVVYVQYIKERVLSNVKKKKKKKKNWAHDLSTSPLFMNPPGTCHHNCRRRTVIIEPTWKMKNKIKQSKTETTYNIKNITFFPDVWKLWLLG